MFYGMNAWFLATLALGAALHGLVALAPWLRRLGGRAAAEGFVASARVGEVLIAGLAAVAAVLGFMAAFDDADALWGLGAAALAAGLAVQAAAMTSPAREIARLAAHVDTEPGAAVDAALAVWIQRAWARFGLLATGVLLYIMAAH